MNVLGTQYIDGYNYFQCGYDILSQANGKTTYRRYLTLTVVSGGYVSWSNGNVQFYNPYYTGATNNTYYAGTHTLAYQDVTVTHQPGQPYNESFHGKITTSYGPANWEYQYGMTFPKMESPTEISTVNGNHIKGKINATFTAETGYTYKLKVSLDGDTTTYDIFDNYTSGTGVNLSDSLVTYIRGRVSTRNVNLKVTLVTYRGTIVVGESSRVLTVLNYAGVHLRTNNVWKDAIPYVRVSGVWKEAIPYARISNQWKEGI